MPKIDSPDFVEGDVVQKSDITKLRDDINETLIDGVDSSNIREEGLDRRVFESGSVVPKFTKTQRAYSSTKTSALASQRWNYLLYLEASDLKGNKAHSNYASTSVRWNPETDTHCVIRLSMYVDSRTTGRRPQDGDNYWDFGLVIVPPGQSRPDSMLTGFEPNAWTTGGIRVSPYQRVGLTGAFNVNRNKGYFTKGQSTSLTRSAGFVEWRSDVSSNERDLIDDGTGGTWATSAGTLGYHDDTYPRGTWYQYAFDRGSNFNSSFSMTAHCTSELSRASEGTSQFFWPDAGTAEIYVVYRSNLPSPTPNFLDVLNLNLSAQIYRR